MADAIATYLHDHLAGSHFAAELLESLRDQYREEELGTFAAAILAEVKQDQEILQKIIERVGEGHFDLMQATGWLAERASQVKLGRDLNGGLGTFEALEVLALGILGKLKLWQVLAAVAEVDPRVEGEDFEKLAAGAQDQHDRMETHRIQFAKITFALDRVQKAQ